MSSHCEKWGFKVEESKDLYVVLFISRNKDNKDVDIVNINNEVIYVAGDTDNTVEAREVTCDIAFVPIGGTYTMNVEEAAELIKTINPKVVVPTHYETIVGSIKDAYDFQNKLKNNIEVKILMK